MRLLPQVLMLLGLSRPRPGLLSVVVLSWILLASRRLISLMLAFLSSMAHLLGLNQQYLVSSLRLNDFRKEN